MAAQAGCAKFTGFDANIIFIEKRISYPSSLVNAFAFTDLSVGYAMFFSRRWMLCAENELC